MDKLVIGIDLGLEGGVCFMDLSGSVRHLSAMPVRKNTHGGKDVDVRELRKVLANFARERVCRVVIEHTHSFGNEARRSIFSFGRGTGRVQALLELEGYGYEEVQPTTWKKVVLAGTKKDKAAAIGWCQARYPSVSLVPPGKEAVSDGLADAVALAEYARRLVTGETSSNA